VVKMFSDCWDCVTCSIFFGGGCLAGHGDNDYIRATPEDIRHFMEKWPAQVRDRWGTYSTVREAIYKMFPELREEIKEFLADGNP